MTEHQMKQMESTDSQDTSDILSEDAQRDRIIRKLRENGCRITQQRLLLLDIILKNQCSSCKEMYAEAVKNDSHIGIATVYRMVNQCHLVNQFQIKIQWFSFRESHCFFSSKT